MNSAQVVIFDCDGTLISTQGQILRAAQQLVSEEWGRPVELKEIQALYTPDMREFAQRAKLPLETQQERLLSRWQELLQTTAPEVVVFPGIESLLRELTELGVELYVWTARDRRSTSRLLQSFDLMSFFHDMRCLDDTEPKPSPQGLIELAGHYTDKSSLFVVGDSFTDMQGARLFGARGLGAAWEVSANPKSLLDAGAERVFSEVEALHQFLLQELGH